MPLAKVIFKPGVEREGSEYSVGPGWYDCNRVRFRQGRPQKIGGWEKYSATAIKGIPRSLFTWKTAAAEAYMGIGTNLKFYVESGGAYYDITPIRATTSAGDATFAATNGSSTLTVTENSHGAVVGDFVTFSGATTLGGLIVADVLNHEYQVATVTNGNTFTVEATDANGATVVANASDTANGGAAVVAAYQLSAGTNTYVGSTGYGAGSWGETAWGGGGALALSGQLRLYSQDQFGDDLIFNPRNGSIYYWDESAGTSARAVDLSTLGSASDTPTTCMQVMVSSLDRHVIAFGVNPIGSGTIDPLLVRWSDQEDAGDWTPTSTNSAGGQVLSTGGSILCAVKTRQEFLIFTEWAIHSMRYTGTQFVYQFSVVSENLSAIGSKAAISIGDAVYFMSKKGFYVYSGALTRIPCGVLDYVFSAIDKSQLQKVHAAANVAKSEVMWFYPAGDEGSEINRYVAYNFAEEVWTIGALARGAWIEPEGRQYPIASSVDNDNINSNYLYNHEYGYDDEGAAMGEYIESGPLEIGDGESFAFLRRIIPDFRFDGATGDAAVTVTIKKADFPLETLATGSTSTVTSSTTQNHVRVRAREVILRLDGTGTGYGWTMGDMRLDLRTDGKR